MATVQVLRGRCFRAKAEAVATRAHLLFRPQVQPICCARVVARQHGCQHGCTLQKTGTKTVGVHFSLLSETTFLSSDCTRLDKACKLISLNTSCGPVLGRPWLHGNTVHPPTPTPTPREKKGPAAGWCGGTAGPVHTPFSDVSDGLVRVLLAGRLEVRLDLDVDVDAGGGGGTAGSRHVGGAAVSVGALALIPLGGVGRGGVGRPTPPKGTRIKAGWG